MSDPTDDFVERLRRDFYVKKGDLLWRRRIVERFPPGPRQQAACKTFNKRFGDQAAGRFADKPAPRNGGLQNGRRTVRIGDRQWPVETLIRAIETGLPPMELPQDGNPYHDEIFIGEGPLATAFAAARAASGFKGEDLLVLARRNDPFALDTAEAHRDAGWFLNHLDRLVGERRIHLHGFHYVLVSAGGVVKPNGEPYRNTHADDDWLAEVAGKRARWLGYVPFDRIDDNRNPDPVIYRPDKPRAPEARIGAVVASYVRDVIEDASLFSCRPFPTLTGFAARQPYAFAYFGEKSSLDPVLRPLAQRYEADMYLAAGELSDTLIWRMARNGAEDGRPLIVFCFSDFDPAGMQMPISIARKLQALKTLLFPTLRGQVVPVALTLAQALDLRLPTTPVKRGDKRRHLWQEAYGPALFEAGLIDAPGQAAQVEIDALAALRPEELTRIAEAAIAPYLDAGLPRRFARAHANWGQAATAAVNAAVDVDAVADIGDRAERAVERHNDALVDLRAAADELADLEIELGEIAADIEPPEPPEPPEAEIDEAAHRPLIDLEWDFVRGTQALKARKSYDDDDA